jgi:hypothetical protein
MVSLPDVPCDMWIIREWRAGEALRSGAVADCNAVLAEVLDDEEAGYGLPADYTCGQRLHVFLDDDCEAWLGCLSTPWISPEMACEWISRMLSNVGRDLVAAEESGPYVVMLDGRSVTGWVRGASWHC